MRPASVLWAVSLLMTALFASTAVEAVEPAKTRASSHKGWEGQLQKKLGLTDDQVQAIRQIRLRDADARTQHKLAVQKAEGELRRAIASGANQSVIEAKQIELQRLAAAGVEYRVKLLQEISPIFTPEQREAFAQLAEKGGRPH